MKLFISLLLLLVSAGSSFASPSTWAKAKIEALQKMCDTDTLLTTSQLGLYVYDLTANAPLFAHNEKHRMRPASCQKLVTSIAALHFLGSQYEALTNFFYAGAVMNGTLYGNIYVEGGMDPLLHEQDLKYAVEALQRAGIDSIAGGICVDLSRKDTLRWGEGWCWDDEDGPLSALLIDGKASVQAPLLRQFLSSGLRLANRDSVLNAVCPPGATLFCQLIHSLPQMLLPALKESDNMVAESIFYQLAFQTSFRNAGAPQAIACIKGLMNQLDISPRAYTVADGSGLSLYNYTTAETLVALLRYAHSQEDIFVPLQQALPVAGEDGTLIRRMQDTAAKHHVWAKTGTVTGVSSLAGYLLSGEGHLLAFAIINQGIEKTRQGRDFQDRVCELLATE